MAARKKVQAKSRQKTRRPLSDWFRPALVMITVTFSAAGLGLMLNWMNDPREWPVDTVQIKGDFRYLKGADLQGVVSPLAEGGFFAVNVGLIQEHVQQMPWVEQVSVRRVWPDRLTVQVRERVPVAHWGETSLLNARATVFEPDQLPELQDLPKLNGPQGHEQRVLDMYRDMQATLQPLQLSVEALELDARRAWRVRLNNGLTVDVGRNNPARRIARFVRVYPSIMASENGRVESVDLRYSNGFAIRWQDSDSDKQTRKAG